MLFYRKSICIFFGYCPLVLTNIQQLCELSMIFSSKEIQSLDEIPHSLCVSEREKKKGGLTHFFVLKLFFSSLLPMIIISSLRFVSLTQFSGHHFK